MKQRNWYDFIKKDSFIELETDKINEKNLYLKKNIYTTKNINGKEVVSIPCVNFKNINENYVVVKKLNNGKYELLVGVNAYMVSEILKIKVKALVVTKCNSGNEFLLNLEKEIRRKRKQRAEELKEKKDCY